MLWTIVARSVHGLVCLVIVLYNFKKLLVEMTMKKKPDLHLRCKVILTCTCASKPAFSL